MISSSGYLIDSDVLITAKNRYYAFRICPGFWDRVLHGHALGRIHSIDRVKQELLLGRSDDDLVRWVGQSVPAGFFLSSDVGAGVAAFTRVMLRVTRHVQYDDEAKAKFASGAAGWLAGRSRHGKRKDRGHQGAATPGVAQPDQVARCLPCLLRRFRGHFRHAAHPLGSNTAFRRVCERCPRIPNVFTSRRSRLD